MDALTLQRIAGEFTVCKVADYAQVDWHAQYCFLGQTDGEKSLVCPVKSVPSRTLAREDGWKAFRVRGTLDFSLTGVIAGISAVLAEKGIGVFVVSTYDTDYVFTKAQNYEQALEALAEAGYITTD